VSLEADIIRFKNKSEDWIAFVGLFADKPYEIFTGKLSDIDREFRLPAKIVKGNVVKVPVENGEHRYDLQYNDSNGAPQTLPSISALFNKEYWNYARLISGAMRSSIPVIELVNIIDHMRSEEESINSWKAGVKRALKRYIPNGTATQEECEHCGSNNLVYQEGCLTCLSCGSSKCG
jgi:ribonucleoside-diphosphate reductase alpha chain